MTDTIFKLKTITQQEKSNRSLKICTTSDGLNSMKLSAVHYLFTIVVEFYLPIKQNDLLYRLNTLAMKNRIYILEHMYIYIYVPVYLRYYFYISKTNERRY